MSKAWLEKAVFYEIYPQSFYDTNGDGIGDFEGIIQKLDYIKDLGCNALWLNPCFDSPFKDAGYDVRDYKKVAPRYGTNEDLYHLFEAAHKKGIRVLLDLVAGHTSEEHEWFKMSSLPEENEYSGRFIWTDNWLCGMPGHPYIGGECGRNGTYMLNFFKCQPALNYGWKEPEYSWQMPMDAPDCILTRDAMKDVIRFWLSKGCDGFRVDMAASLVKGDDEDKSGTCRVWRDIFSDIKKDYPEAAFVAEWGIPGQSVQSAGFDMDFLLDWQGNGYNSLLRDFIPGGENRSYFSKNSGTSLKAFMDQWLPAYEAAKGKGHVCLITGNHDTPRFSYGLDEREMKLACAFIFTMPGAPYLYYGDEIGMRYNPALPTKEGGYTRTGTRTPMQWSSGKNLGFSDAAPEELYLPVDGAEDAPTVENQAGRKDSLYNTVKELLKLRQGCDDLDAGAPFEALAPVDGRAFAYKRGNLIIVLNPSDEEQTLTVNTDGRELIYSIGSAQGSCGKTILAPQSFAVFG